MITNQYLLVIYSGVMGLLLGGVSTAFFLPSKNPWRHVSKGVFLGFVLLFTMVIFYSVVMA